MSEEKLTWPQAVADSARRIATPVAQQTVFIVALAWLGCWIASAKEISGWKGGLLTGVLAIFAGIATASVWMAIFKPRHLTFDKDAHKEIDVNDARGAVVFDALELEPEDEEDDEDGPEL
jgi:hypothetical protein